MTEVETHDERRCLKDDAEHYQKTCLHLFSYVQGKRKWLLYHSNHHASTSTALFRTTSATNPVTD